MVSLAILVLLVHPRRGPGSYVDFFVFDSLLVDEPCPPCPIRLFSYPRCALRPLQTVPFPVTTSIHLGFPVGEVVLGPGVQLRRFVLFERVPPLVFVGPTPTPRIRVAQITAATEGTGPSRGTPGPPPDLVGEGRGLPGGGWWVCLLKFSRCLALGILEFVVWRRPFSFFSVHRR